jgi:molybdopterin-containing oxidoreductase family membrane subunit
MSALDPLPGDPLGGAPLVEGRHTDAQVTRSLLGYLHSRPTRLWWLLFGTCMAGTVLLAVAMIVTFARGVGTWGVMIPVAWGFAITSFVWWIGIGHAGTLISAFLLLMTEKWRSSINRIAEAMTLFAVLCAALFPLLHLGRPWKFYYLAPYPSTTHTWPQFRSPLTWDMAAVSTYLTVSLLFWYLGLIPDLATARDMARTRFARKAFGLLCLGWRGSARHWKHWRVGYLLLAGLATPLVVSVHTIVSFDFAVAQVPGWHSTIFPPYFVAGAVFCGFAMVLVLLIPARKALGIEHVVTARHLDLSCRMLLATSLMVAYGYLQEHFTAWYSGDLVEMHVFEQQRTGPYWPLFWVMITTNVLIPQLFWSARMRASTRVIWIAAVLINVGMWIERFLIVVAPLSRDFLPSSWKMFHPTWVDWSLLAGTLGFFGASFLLFLKLLPAVPISELKELQRDLDEAEAFRERIRSTAGGAQ